MAKYALKIVGWMLDRPCPITGEYLEKFDFEQPQTEQLMWFTSDPAQAQAFPDAGAAIEAWKTVRQFDGLRPDGMPDRPLSAFSVTVVDLASLGVV